MNEHAPVVVGIDDSPRTSSMVQWAAVEATSRGVGLRVVSAYHWALLYPWEFTYELEVPELERLRAHCEQFVADTVAEVRAANPALSVTGDAVHGIVADVLLAEAEHASLLVLGSQQSTLLGASVLGSINSTVTARSHCPVVVERSAVVEPPGECQVVAGVDGTAASETVLAFAFEYASRRQVPLRVVLCWGVDSIVAARWRLQEPSAERVRMWLAEALAGWQEKYPDVEIHSEVMHDKPVAGLVAASTASDLIVVGTRGRNAVASRLLGSVSQGVLRHAVCPVVVVPTHVD